MSLIKTSVTIPDDIYKQAKEESGNLSELVTEALREHLRRKKVEKAARSFGSWEKREKSSIEIVNDLRQEEARKYADRSR